jgi:hypothetical protein
MLAMRHVEHTKMEFELEKAKRDQADHRAALICAVLANIYRDKKRKSTPFKPEDFMPEYEQKVKKQQTPEEQFAIVKMLNAAFGGNVVE